MANPVSRAKGPLGAAAFLALMMVVSAPLRADDATTKLYKTKCAMCHGADGSGKTVVGEKLKAPDLRSDEVQKKTDADLNCLITKGKDKMPAYGKTLMDGQIKELVVYVRELAKKK